MKYLVTIIAMLAAAQVMAQTPSRQSGQSRSFVPNAGSTQQQKYMVPPSGNPYVGRSYPGVQPPTTTRRYYPSQPGAGGTQPMMVPPYGQSYSPGKSYSPSSKSSKATMPDGAVDVPMSRSRIVRRSEETRSSSAPENGVSRSKKSEPKSNKAATQQGVSYSRMSPGYDQPAMRPREMSVEMRDSTGRLSEAIKNGSPEEVDQHIESIRTNFSEMKGRLRNEPKENQLKLSSIERTYQEGTEQLEEGRRSGEQSKIDIGLEKIEKANEQLEEIE
jgi:hypothetical protein